MFVDEWGTFSLAELESIQLPFGMKIERDLYFKEKTFKEEIEKKKPKRELNLKSKKTDKDKGEALER